MFTIRWTGLGILSFLLWMASFFGAFAIPLWLPGGHAGRIFANIVIGLVVGAGANFLLGAALNRRRDKGGGWVWTERHTLYGLAVQDASVFFLVMAALLAPLATAGYVPHWLTFALWLTLPITGYLLLRRERSRSSSGRKLAQQRGWTYQKRAGQVWSCWPTLLDTDRPFTSPVTDLIEGRAGDLPVGVFTAQAGGHSVRVWVVHLPVAYPSAQAEDKVLEGLRVYSGDPEFARALLNRPDIAEITHRGGLSGWRLIDRDLILVRSNAVTDGWRAHLEVILDAMIALARAVASPDLAQRHGRSPVAPPGLAQRALYQPDGLPGLQR